MIEKNKNIAELENSKVDFIEKKQIELKTEIAKLVDEYNQKAKEKENKVESAKVAFVTFRSMEGAARCKKAYANEKSYISWCKKLKIQKKSEHLDFYGNILKVRSTTDPPMIVWENLGTRQRVRWSWLFLTYSCSFLIIFLSLLTVYTIDEQT